MSHSLVPQRAPTVMGSLGARYTNEAFALMCAELGSGGISLKECRAKLVGGGNMASARLQRART